MRFRNLLKYTLSMPFFLLTSVSSNSLYMSKYSITLLAWINWDGELSGYAENPDNWIII